MGESMAMRRTMTMTTRGSERPNTVGVSLSQSVSVSLVVICISRKNPAFDYAVLERARLTEVSFFSESRADLDF